MNALHRKRVSWGQLLCNRGFLRVLLIGSVHESLFIAYNLWDVFFRSLPVATQHYDGKCSSEEYGSPVQPGEGFDCRDVSWRFLAVEEERAYYVAGSVKDEFDAVCGRTLRVAGYVGGHKRPCRQIILSIAGQGVFHR